MKKAKQLKYLEKRTEKVRDIYKNYKTLMNKVIEDAHRNGKTLYVHGSVQSTLCNPIHRANAIPFQLQTAF